MSKPRILFYVERDLHLPFLEPIHDYLAANDLAKTAFSSPEWFAGNDITRARGCNDKLQAYLAAKSQFFANPQDFSPDVTIVADACHSTIPQLKHIINVGHGMICKGAFYTDSPIIRRENLSELICVPGPWHKRRLAKNVFIPIITTGFMKSDLLFGANAVSREDFCQSLGIDPNKKIVLFAPTYNPELSTVPCVWDEIAEIATPDRELLIKLHNVSDESWKDLYRNMAEKHANIHYLTDADYGGMMHAADLMISDVSSIYIEFLLLDKPLVLFNNPEMTNFRFYRPNEIEYLARGAATQVASFEELRVAVSEELSDPERLSARRKQYIPALDYGRDGKSAKRAAEAILDWCKGKIKENVPETTVVLLAEKWDEEGKKAAALRFAPLFERQNAKFAFCTPKEASGDNIAQLTEKSEFVLFVHADFTFQSGLLKYLHNHFCWNAGCGLVKAITDHQMAQNILSRFLAPGQQISVDAVLSFGLKNMACGQSADGTNITSFCVLTLRELALNLKKTASIADFFTRLDKMALVEQQKIILAADCYSWL